MAMKEKGTGNTETKSFVPAAPKQRKSDGGRTKTFDSVKKPRSGGFFDFSHFIKSFFFN